MEVLVHVGRSYTVVVRVLLGPGETREFIMETDASLNGLGTILSQQGKDGKICITAYASHSLPQSGRSMCIYSSPKLELLVPRGM